MLQPDLNPDHVDVDALQGAAPWIGGKRNLARLLVDRIEAIPHACYAEPFVGMGGVFLRRRRRPPAEAINDRSRDVANLFRILQRHPEALFGELDFQIAGRAEFDRQIRVDPSALTDVERAARFIYLQFNSYGGKPSGRTFGLSATTGARFSWPRMETLFRKIHARLSGAVIDCLPCADFLQRWDRPATLFYLDPPYWCCEDYYGKGLFERDDFARLAVALARLRGRFLMSINDRPEVRALFGGFRIEEVTTTYTTNGPKPTSELLISDCR